MATKINLLGNRPSAALFSPLEASNLRTKNSIERAVNEAETSTLWVASESRFTNALLVAIFGGRSRPRPSRKLGRLLLLHEPRLEDIQPLAECFTPFAWPTHDFHMLPDKQLAEVLDAPNRRDLAIGGYVNLQTDSLTLFRGDLTHLVVPLSIFSVASDSTTPDTTEFGVADYGHTIRLGDFESSTDLVLYEMDEDYRRRLKRERRQGEQTFGASLRRLRIQRGLLQSDFEPQVSRRTIVDIEQDRRQRFHARTLEQIAKRLRVPPDAIGEY